MNHTIPTSILARLRALVPKRDLRFSEALRIAELQASRFRELQEIDEPYLPVTAITDLPRISVSSEHGLPVSGLTHWMNGRWLIALNASEPRVRQRFSLAHELFHVISHTNRQWMHPSDDDQASSVAAEQQADYFAGCLLMPKRHIKRLFGEGLSVPQLARAFGTSTRAIEVRLAQLGLSDGRPRCARTDNTWPSIRKARRGSTYQRSLPALEGALT